MVKIFQDSWMVCLVANSDYKIRKIIFKSFANNNRVYVRKFNYQ